jgi:hypothetical protein
MARRGDRDTERLVRIPLRGRTNAIASIRGTNTKTRHALPVMTSTNTGLLVGWFNDAGSFPPAALTITQAVANHARHHVSWYDALLASFVSIDSRLVKLDTYATRLGLRRLDVTVVVPAGLGALPDTLATLHRCPRLRLRAIEVPLAATPIPTAAHAAGELAELDVALYVEVPNSPTSERQIHQLRTHGMGLKLRGGGSSVFTFNPEDHLALTILHCAAERLPFTCATGVSRAVRHQDPNTLLQRHGFLNITLATLAAVTTGSHATVRDILADTDHHTIADTTRTLPGRDVATIRTLLTRVSSNDISQTVTDLTTLTIITKT